MDQVEEIKGKIDIAEVVGEYVPLKKAGRNFKGLCPFHGEKTPSFTVNTELQIFKCFGCGASGDVYSFVQKIEGMEFGEVLQTLAARVGVKLESYKPTRMEEERERLIKINVAAAQAYHYLLTKHKIGKKAWEYVKGRGITEEMILKFQMGYAPDGWDFSQKFLVAKKGFLEADVERAGLMVRGRGVYDRFRERIMFPLANARGQIVGFAGRVLPGADERSGGKYVNTPETEVYHKSELLYGFDTTRSEIKLAGWAVVVEGEIDMIASYQTGVKNVVAIKGSALTERQVELLRRVCDQIVMALDADVAGDAAARRGIEIAEKAGLTVKIARWKEGKDPGDLAILEPEEWKKAVVEAIPIYDFYLESAVTRHGLDVVGKKKIGQELLPIWASISDEIVKGHYIQKLAEVVGVKEEDVRAQLNKIANPNTTPGNANQDVVVPLVENTTREMREEWVVKLAILGEKIDQLIRLETEGMIMTDFWKRVVEEFKNGKTVKTIVPELREKVTNLVLSGEEFSDKLWSEAKSLLELEDIGERLTRGLGPTEAVVLGHRKAELTREK